MISVYRYIAWNNGQAPLPIRPAPFLEESCPTQVIPIEALPYSYQLSFVPSLQYPAIFQGHSSIRKPRFQRKMDELLDTLKNLERKTFAEELRKGLESLFAVVECKKDGVFIDYSIHQRVLSIKRLARVMPPFLDQLLELAREKRALAETVYVFPVEGIEESDYDRLGQVKVGDLLRTFQNYFTHSIQLENIDLSSLPQHVIGGGESDTKNLEGDMTGLEVEEDWQFQDSPHIIHTRERLDLKAYSICDNTGAPATEKDHYLERWLSGANTTVRWTIVESYLSGLYSPGLSFPTISEIKETRRLLLEKNVPESEKTKKEELLECLELALGDKDVSWLIQELALMNPSLNIAVLRDMTLEALKGLYILYSTLPAYEYRQIDDIIENLNKRNLLNDTLERFAILHEQGVRMYQRAFLGSGENALYHAGDIEIRSLLAELDTAIALSNLPSINSLGFPQKARIDRNRITKPEEDYLYDELWALLPPNYQLGYLPKNSTPDLELRRESGDSYLIEVKRFAARKSLGDLESLAKISEQLMRMALLARQKGGANLVCIAHVDNTTSQEANVFKEKITRCLSLTDLPYAVILVPREKGSRIFLGGNISIKEWGDLLIQKFGERKAANEQACALPIPRREVLKIRQLLGEEAEKSRGLESIDREIVKKINEWLPMVNLRRNINRRDARKAIYRVCRHPQRAILQTAIETALQTAQISSETKNEIQQRLAFMKRDFGNCWGTTYIDHMWYIAECLTSSNDHLDLQHAEDKRIKSILKTQKSALLEHLYNWEIDLEEALRDFNKLGQEVVELALDTVNLESPLELTATPRHPGYNVQEIIDYLNLHPEEKENQLVRELYRSLEYLAEIHRLLKNRISYKPAA